MKKISIFCFLFSFVSIIAQPRYSNNYLSSAFNPHVQRLVNISLGARGYYDGKNGADSYLQSRILINSNIVLGTEINFQSEIFDTKKMNLFLTGFYKLSNSFSLGGFSNFETSKYGLVVSYIFLLSGFQLEAKGISDIEFDDYIYSFSMGKNIIEDFDLIAEFLVSEGNIQSNINKSLILLSAGLEYTIVNFATVFGSYGVNLKDQYKFNNVDYESIINIGVAINF